MTAAVKRIRRWAVWSHRWWMVQYSLDWTFSLGIHIDPCIRRYDECRTYGPYVDLHLVFLMVSLGNRPGLAENDSLMRPGRW